MVRRFLIASATLMLLLAGLAVAPGMGTLAVLAQGEPCDGFTEWSQLYLAEEQRYGDEVAAIVDTEDLRAIASATPQQLNEIVEAIETHLKNLDEINAPDFAADWQRANVESLDLTQALFADGALNGIFTILVDYHDQSLRSDQEIAQARIDATVACAEFDAFATEIDLLDGELSDPVPGFATWSSCDGLDELGIAIDRANLQALVEVPAALEPLAEFGGEWEVDPSIGWNQLQFLSLADYYEAVARILEQTPAPEYATPWFQNLIAFDREVGTIIRGAYDHGGILAASAATGSELATVTASNENAVVTGTQGCGAFQTSLSIMDKSASLEDVEPISAEEIRSRQQVARERASAAGYDALLVVGRSFYDRPGDLAYLSGHFPPFPTTVFSEGNRGMGHAFLLLPVAGEPVLLTDARKHRPDLVVVDDVRAAGDLGLALIDLLRETFLEDGIIGLVGDDILPAALDRQLLHELPGLSLDPEPDIVAGMRAIKSPRELDLLRRAALCADAALMTANAMIRRGGVTEREVCAEAIAAAMRAGADFVRYFRVHSGPWSAYGSRWPQAMNRAIEPGENVALDAIGAYQGYGFDVNRTTVCGSPSADTRRLLETTLEATTAAVAQIRAGVAVATVADAAVEVMQRSRYDDYFAGMMGHGIGLETVELPYLKVGEPTTLLPNMVLCVEPGLFIPDVAGAAIEQEVIVHARRSAEVITPTPPNLWEWD